MKVCWIHWPNNDASVCNDLKDDLQMVGIHIQSMIWLVVIEADVVGDVDGGLRNYIHNLKQ